MPITGRQSTIDKPDPVKRVIPPTTNMITTLTHTHRSQSKMGFGFCISLTATPYASSTVTTMDFEVGVLLTRAALSRGTSTLVSGK